LDHPLKANSKSINALLKECTGYKKQQWALFNDKIKDAVQQQQSEMEKAMIGYGLRPQYSSLTIPVEKWFRMSTEQQQRSINKLNTTNVHRHPNSKQPLTLASSEQPAYSKQPLTSTIHHAPTNVVPDAGSQDITIRQFATGDEQSATREE